jgi:glycosyltransferase involved in cell wall biosynthesis
VIDLHLVLGSTQYDSRILKETAAIDRAGMFDRVLVLGLTDEMHGVERREGGRTTREFSLRTRGLPRNLAGQSIKFAEWRSRILRACRGLPIGVVHCHDLLPLPVAVRIKRDTGAKLIYDAHELETERAGLRGLRRRLAQRTERRMMRHVDAIVTVSPSIVDWYRNRHPGVEVVLVRNVPERVPVNETAEPLRDRLGVPDDAALFISIGGFSRGRGIERALCAFADDSVRHHVVFMGFGPLAGEIDAAAAGCARIHRIPPVSPDEVVWFAAGADVGLSLTEDSCLNHRFCLPNKVFESLVAGVPVLCSDLPDQANLIRGYGAGWTVGASIEALVRRLTEISIDDARRIRSDLRDRVAELGWDREAERLVDLYRRLLGRDA